MPNMSAAATRHGRARRERKNDRAYRAWCHMRERCMSPSSPVYKHYGAGGIAFAGFLADMGDPPPGTSLERIDNDGPYSPENCRWASLREQARNKRTTRVLAHDGRAQCLADWAFERGLSASTLRKRLALGWSVARALTEPTKAGATAQITFVGLLIFGPYWIKGVWQ